MPNTHWCLGHCFVEQGHEYEHITMPVTAGKSTQSKVRPLCVQDGRRPLTSDISIRGCKSPIQCLLYIRTADCPALHLWSTWLGAHGTVSTSELDKRVGLHLNGWCFLMSVISNNRSRVGKFLLSSADVDDRSWNDHLGIGDHAPPKRDIIVCVHIVRATHKADELLAANGITSWVLRQSRMCWKQARIFQLIFNWNPVISTKQKRYRKQGRPAKRWEDDINAYLQPTRTNRGYTDLTNDTTRHGFSRYQMA